MIRTDAYYEQKLKQVLGKNLNGFEIEGARTKHPKIHVAYTDYKPVPIVRAELQMVMPEVDFTEVDRQFTNGAYAFYFLEYLLFAKFSKILDGGQEYDIMEFVNADMFDYDFSQYHYSYTSGSQYGDELRKQKEQEDENHE